MNEQINYSQLMHKAMRRLMSELLEEVGKNGLPGEHHFFVTFDTNHPGVDIADWLRERYPEEMTIVIQHWFENLSVMEDRFSITLNFGDQPEPMVVPFEAIKTFVDPSVEFGLRFEPTDDEVSDSFEDIGESPMIEIPDDEELPNKDADVVSLDSFRKN